MKRVVGCVLTLLVWASPAWAIYRHGTAKFGTTTAASITPVLPTNWVANDVVVVCFTKANQGAVTAPANYTAQIAQNFNTATDGLYCFTHLLVGGDTNPVFSWTGSVAVAWVTAGYTGVGVAIVDGTPASQSNASLLVATSPSITTATSASTLLMIYGVAANRTLISPSKGSIVIQAALTGAGVGIVDYSLPATEATGNQTINWVSVTTSAGGQFALVATPSVIGSLMKSSAVLGGSAKIQ